MKSPERLRGAPPTIWDYISDYIGLDAFRIAVHRERNIRASGEFLHPYPKLEVLVQSLAFKLAGKIFTIIYFAFVFIEVSNLAHPGSTPGDLMILEIIFIGIAAAEFYMKYLCDGWVRFAQWSHFVELVVVCGSVVETFLIRQVSPPSIFRFGRVLVCRMIPLGSDVLMSGRYEGLLSPLRHIRMFFLGFAWCFKSLLWLFTIFFFMIFCVACVMTEFVAYGAGFEHIEWVDEYFGNVFRSMFTMLQIATLDDWSAITRKLALGSGTTITVCVVIFVSISNWAFLSLITGVLIDGALHAGKIDEASDEMLRQEKHKKVVLEFAHLLEGLETKPGITTKDDFNAARNHPSITQSMATIGASKEDLVGIWNILDPADGEVITKKYVDMFLRWFAKPTMGDVMVFMSKIQEVGSEIRDMKDNLERIETETEQLQASFALIAQNQSTLLQAVRDAKDGFEGATLRLTSTSVDEDEEGAEKKLLMKESFSRMSFTL